MSAISIIALPKDPRKAAPRIVPKVDKVRPDFTHYCGNCSVSGGGEKRLLLCKGCRTTWYCGAECQKKHWKIHKPICQEHVAMNRFGSASENVSPAMLAMEKWVGNYKPALSEAVLQALFLTRTARGQGHLLETHILMVRIKETSSGSDHLELVSARVEPTDFLKGCFGPETYAELLEEVRGKEEREKQSRRVCYRIIGSMVICIHCLSSDIRQVLPTGIPYTVVENSSDWPVDPNWETTLKDRITNYRFFCAPDASTYAVPRERPAAGGVEKKGSKKKKSGCSV